MAAAIADRVETLVRMIPTGVSAKVAGVLGVIPSVPAIVGGMIGVILATLTLKEVVFAEIWLGPAASL